MVKKSLKIMLRYTFISFNRIISLRMKCYFQSSINSEVVNCVYQQPEMKNYPHLDIKAKNTMCNKITSKVMFSLSWSFVIFEYQSIQYHIFEKFFIYTKIV